MKIKLLIVLSALLATTLASGISHASDDDGIPDLKGNWVGMNLTLSESKGYKEWQKTITITEQKDRRFKGNFTYSEGKKEFYGIIHPDNDTFTWVSAGSKGYNLGRILDDNIISACYVEAGDAMTVGCAELRRDE